MATGKLKTLFRLTLKLHESSASPSLYGRNLMMTSSIANSFRVTGPLCVKFNGHRWIPGIKASDAEPSRSLWRHCYVTFNGGFHTERNSDAETVSTISWRRHGYKSYHTFHEDIIGTFVKCGGHLTVEQHPRDIRCAGFSKARKRINLKLLEVNRVRYIWLPRSLPGIIQINNMLNNYALQWRHSGCDGVSNNQPNDFLLNRLFSADQRKHQSSASLVFWGELTGDRWIPRTKGKYSGKYFHLMTSSWAFL